MMFLVFRILLAKFLNIIYIDYMVYIDYIIHKGFICILIIIDPIYTHLYKQSLLSDICIGADVKSYTD